MESPIPPEYVAAARDAVAYINITGADKARNSLARRMAERDLIKSARKRAYSTAGAAASDVANLHEEGLRLKDKHACAIRRLCQAYQQLGQAYFLSLPKDKDY